MGVQGLKTYVESSSRNDLRNLPFRDNRLIIDGCNLYYSLYYESRVDQAHGGDYDGFEKVITQFFENLLACDIRPYVVIDGGLDHSENKLDTIMKRKQQKIKDAYHLFIGMKANVLPLLVTNVFKQVLQKLKVPLVQCLEEADWEIAALAKEWNCPVLSNDSDFYVFNLEAGFLPISQFWWRKVRVNRRTNKKFIQAKHFTAARFCASYKMNVDLLPVFASILGNDYVKLENLKKLGWEKYANSGIENAHMDGLLKWLSQFPGPEAAISALLKLIRNKEKVQEELLKGIRGYTLIPGSLAQFFSSKTVPEKVCTGPLQALPKWTLKPLLEGKMSSSVIDVLVSHKTFLASQVEDFQLESSSDTSRPIRQVFYGLLLLGEQELVDKQELAVKALTSTSKHCVDEYSRQQLSVSCEKVEAIQTKVMEGLKLETLSVKPHRVRLQVILNTLGVSSEMSKEIPCALKLQIFATRYWLVNAQPQPSQVHLWGLLLGMVYGQFSSSPKTQADILYRLQKLQTGRKRIPLVSETAHTYSQWQSCLKWSLDLNRLLSFPLNEPECTRLYRGTLVHQVVEELRRGASLESLLIKGSNAELFFKQLKIMIVRLVGEDFIKKMKTGLQLRDAEKTQRGYKALNQPMDDLNCSFEHLILEDPDEDDDDDRRGSKKKGKAKGHQAEMPECSYTIRTRHKSKARNANHPSKKHERRCFE